MQKSSLYRRDIDGLRAVAVLPVVIYHIAQSLLRGGYVGVDIFFVISGFLISDHIIRDVTAKKFSIFNFYNRRVRRIMPAFLALLAIVTALALWRFFPADATSYGAALLAALGSVSNIYFWSSSGYFAPAAETMPLLHTWSLGVEEQFYLVLPLVILAIARWVPRRLPAAVLILLVASLGLSMYAVKAFPTGGFYLLPTRAWELLIGTTVAMGIVPLSNSAIVRNIEGFLGLGMIGASMLLYSPSTPFPGIAALLPCLGAAFVIHSGQRGDTWVVRLLSLPPLVFVGLISYSLYLWHWPVMVFQRSESLLLVTNSKMLERGAVLGVSLVAATLSWALIERPTRNRGLVSDRKLWMGVGVGFALLTIAGLTLLATKGMPDRFPPSAARLAAFGDENTAEKHDPCFFLDARPFSTLDRTKCLPNAPGKPTYLVVGDSHAAALGPALRAAFPEANILQVSAAGCLPVMATTAQSITAACTDAMRFGLKELPNQRRIDAIWVIGRFAHDNDIRRRVRAAMGTATDLMHDGQKVVLVGPNPEYTVSLPRVLARSAITGDGKAAERHLSDQPFAADALFKEAAAKTPGLGYVSLTDALCDGRDCRTLVRDGYPILRDTDHLTPDGAKLVVAAIRAELQEKSKR